MSTLFRTFSYWNITSVWVLFHGQQQNANAYTWSIHRVDPGYKNRMHCLPPRKASTLKSFWRHLVPIFRSFCFWTSSLILNLQDSPHWYALGIHWVYTEIPLAPSSAHFQKLSFLTTSLILNIQGFSTLSSMSAVAPMNRETWLEMVNKLGLTEFWSDILWVDGLRRYPWTVETSVIEE